MDHRAPLKFEDPMSSVHCTASASIVAPLSPARRAARALRDFFAGNELAHTVIVIASARARVPLINPSRIPFRAL